MLAVPITLRRLHEPPERLGVLAVDSTKPKHFTLESLLLASVLARYAAIALSQAAIVDDTRATYEAMLQETKSALDHVLVRNLLHDGKNFVRNVVNALEKMQDDLADTAFGKRRSSDFRDQITRMQDLYEIMEMMLLRFPKPSARKDLDEGPADLRAIAQRVVNVLSLEDSGLVDIQLRAEPGPHLVQAAPSQLLAILYNLAVNAVAAIRKSEKRGSVYLSLGVSPEAATFYRIEVEDQGPGMEKGVLDSLRKGESYSGLPGGFGLGLWTVRETVKSLGGHMRIDSKFGQGTRFILDLPAANG